MQRSIIPFLKGRFNIAVKQNAKNHSNAENSKCFSGLTKGKNISLVAHATKTTSITHSTELTTEAEGIPCDAGMPSAARDFA